MTLIKGVEQIGVFTGTQTLRSAAARLCQKIENDKNATNHEID